MIKEFFFMLKRMGKKGRLGRRFINDHAHRDEDDFRDEVLKELSKIKEEKRGKKLGKLIDKLESRRTYADLSDRGHIENKIKVVNDVGRQVQGPDEEKERLWREIEELKEELKRDRGGRTPVKDRISVSLTEKAGGKGVALFIVLLAGFVFRLDKQIAYGGIDIDVFFGRFTEPGLWIRILFNLFVLAALVWYFITHLEKKDLGDFLTYAVFVFLTSLIVSFGALGFSFYHLIMAYLLYFLYIVPAAEEKGWNLKKVRVYMCILLFIDYFGFGLAKYAGLEQLGNRYLFPIWSYVILFVKLRTKRHWISTGALIVLILWNLSPFAPDLYLIMAGETATQKEIAAGGEVTENFIQKMVGDVKKVAVDIVGNIKQKYIKQYEYATGMRYEGRVEENENIPLGVYFEEVKASASEFYEDEPIEVWGNLLVRTLDRDTPVTVNLGCVYEEENIPGKVGGEENFTIYTMEEEVIECRFDAGKIPKGRRKIRLNADFNFKTMAYLKSYVMDKESLRSMRREGIDVFDYYGIRDKEPIAIFTNGPVEIGMETNAPPIGLDEDSTPYLGITIKNQWSGNIKNISEMIVQIPKGMEFFDDCDKKFDVVTEGIDPDYNGYKLNNRGVRYFKMPIEKDEINYRSLRCLMQIKDKSRVLGDVPLTTKYFRTTISYDYELFQNVRVNIKQVLMEEKYVIGGTCEDGNNYKRILSKIDDSDLSPCKSYLGNFSKYHSNMANNDKIDLLMVLSVAKQESGCRALNDGGIMQVDEDGKKKDYRDVKPEDVPGCEEGEDCKVVAQIIDGIKVLGDTYAAVKKGNSKKDYGINELDLIKFTLLGYNRGVFVALEAMRYHHGGMLIYDAMKYGCEGEYLGKTNKDGYNMCTGEKSGKEAVGLGAAYPGAVFEIYGKACEDMGGTYDDEGTA